MKTWCFIMFLILSFSKNVFPISSADTLNILYQKLIKAKSNEEIIQLNNAIYKSLEEASKFDFRNLKRDSLRGISIVSNKNKSIYIITHDLFLPEKRIVSYKGYIFQKQKENWKVTVLRDTGMFVKKFETFNSTDKKWLGCIYYDCIEMDENSSILVLLAANFSDKIVKKKWIEALYADGKSIRFGEPVFEKMNIKRYMLQYSSEISVSLKFDEKRKNIVFDHLVPKSPELKGQYQFYVNDLSYDAFEIKRKSLIFKSDIDARNSKTLEDKNLRTPK